MKKLFHRFLREEGGLSTLEIVVITGLSIMCFIGIILALSTKMREWLGKVWEKITGAGESLSEEGSI